MSSIARRLAAKNTVEVRQETPEGPIFWRVRRMSTAEAAACGGLEGLVSAGVAKAEPERKGSMAPSVAQQVAQARGLVTLFDGVLKVAVIGVRSENEPWETVRLVDPDRENAEAGLLSTATLSQDAVNDVILAALGGALKAGDTVGSFRSGPAEPAAAD